MEIFNIDIRYYHFNKFDGAKHGLVHIKQLPYLSLVQSQRGMYGIKIDDGEGYITEEGGFFIAPFLATQKITHYENEKREFTARYVFLEVIVNRKYRLEEIFDLPVITDKEQSLIFSHDFDSFEAADNLCDKMSCLYKIVGHLISISKSKHTLPDSELTPLFKYFEKNYKRNITVGEMADILNISESNLYMQFKKITGLSPVKYLNNYRLSVASELLITTDEPIKEIAEKVGICDQFYFSRLFKRNFLMSPREYRENVYK